MLNYKYNKAKVCQFNSVGMVFQTLLAKFIHALSDEDEIWQMSTVLHSKGVYQILSELAYGGAL